MKFNLNFFYSTFSNYYVAILLLSCTLNIVYDNQLYIDLDKLSILIESIPHGINSFTKKKSLYCSWLLLRLPRDQQVFLAALPENIVLLKFLDDGQPLMKWFYNMLSVSDYYTHVWWVKYWICCKLFEYYGS